MKTSEMIWGGLIATAIFIELNPKARKKVRQFTGLSDKGKNKKEKVKDYLIKRGINKKEVDDMLKQEYNYVVKTYPNATPSKIADIIRVLY